MAGQGPVAAALALPMTLTFRTFELIDRATARRLESVTQQQTPGGCLPSTPRGHPRGLYRLALCTG